MVPTDRSARELARRPGRGTGWMAKRFSPAPHRWNREAGVTLGKQKGPSGRESGRQ